MARHYLITGGTDGIGRATALAIAKTGAHIILVARNPEKADDVLEEIQEETYNQNVSYLLADLSSQAEIRQLATEYCAKYDRLDVLINNAGGYFYKRQETVDGIELTFALNHLAYFMVTGLLMELLITTGQKTGDARIVNVSSSGHEYRRKGIIFDDLMITRNYNAMKAYSQSKLGNIMFTYELAKRLQGQPVTVSVLHPGFVHTGITRNAHHIAHKIFNRFAWVVATSSAKGAQTSVYLATSDEVRGVSGKYYEKSRPIQSNSASYDESQWKRLWDISLQMTGIDDFPAK